MKNIIFDQRCAKCGFQAKDPEFKVDQTSSVVPTGAMIQNLNFVWYNTYNLAFFIHNLLWHKITFLDKHYPIYILTDITNSPLTDLLQPLHLSAANISVLLKGSHDPTFSGCFQYSSHS